MVARIDEALGKRRRYGEPSTRTPNLKCAHFAKNELAVTNTCAIFNKLFIFAFCVYTSRSFSTYAISIFVRFEHSVCHGILMTTYLAQH